MRWPSLIILEFTIRQSLQGGVSSAVHSFAKESDLAPEFSRLALADIVKLNGADQN